jgi:hypothetical protein
MTHILRRIPGSSQPLSQHLVASVLIDRSLLLEAGRAVLLLLTYEEAVALRQYLAKHAKKFPINGNVEGGE